MSPLRHPLPEELELYVLGALDHGTAARVEGHVRRCEPCAAALAEEARLENTLRTLVPAVGRAPAKVVRLPAPPSRVPAPRPRAGLSGTLAAAAAILLAVWGLEGGRGGPRPSGVAAVMASDALVCEAEGEAPLCRWPGPLFSAAPRETTANVCRPEVLSCVPQSRMP